MKILLGGLLVVLSYTCLDARAAPLQNEKNISFTLSDLTFVYPVPTTPAEAKALLRPFDGSSDDNQLLPLETYQKMFDAITGRKAPFRSRVSSTMSDSLIGDEDAVFTYKERLRLVAFRVDPCFEHSGQCLPQIRMIWQPVSSFGRKLLFDDAALHTFYSLNLSDRNFETFLSEYDRLLKKYRKSVNPKEELQVHPLFTALGPTQRNQFQSALANLLVKYCGRKNLWRVTAMKTLIGGDFWTFFGMQVEDSSLIPIPRLTNAVLQGFRTGISENHFHNGDIFPSPIGSSEDQPDLITSIIQYSSLFRSFPQEKQVLLRQSLARIENPMLHSPATLDCVSCHAANTATRIIDRDFPNLKDHPLVKKDTFNTTQNTQDHSSLNIHSKNLRALGYFDDKVIFSNRVRMETAAVRDRLMYQE